MFSFLKRKPRAAREPDSVWPDIARRDAALARLGPEALRERGGLVFLLGHFPADLRRLADVLGRAGMPFTDLRERAARSAGLRAGVALLGAEALAADLLPDEPGLVVTLLVAGRHPLLSRDDALDTTADGLAEAGFQVHLARHSALDDPLLEAFGSDRIAALLGKLGMGDGPIVSDLLTSSLRRAQEKIAAKASGDLPADSAAEWLAFNCPDLGRR